MTLVSEVIRTLFPNAGEHDGSLIVPIRFTEPACGGHDAYSDLAELVVTPVSEVEASVKFRNDRGAYAFATALDVAKKSVGFCRCKQNDMYVLDKMVSVRPVGNGGDRVIFGTIGCEAGYVLVDVR